MLIERGEAPDADYRVTAGMLKAHSYADGLFGLTRR